MAGSRKSRRLRRSRAKPLPQGYAAGAGEGEHLVHFRNAGNIFINVDAAKGANNFALGARPSVGSGIPVNRSAHSCCTGFHDLSGNLHHGSACWRWVSLTRMASAMRRGTTGPTNIDRRNSEVTKALPAYAGLSSEHRPPSKFGIFSSERHDAFPLDFAASLASRSAFKRS